MKKLRLDEMLVVRGLAASRAQAKALIMSGRVRSGTERLDKPGKEFASDTELSVTQPPRFVSRGGEKLAAAVETLPSIFAVRMCSTSGLRRAASRIAPCRPAQPTSCVSTSAGRSCTPNCAAIPA